MTTGPFVRSRLSLAVLLILGLLLPGSAAVRAAQPTALVEDVSDGVPGVQPMDYLEMGSTVALAAGQMLTLSYLESCVTERITGGKVTVGSKESTIEGGKLDRQALPCDGGKLLLTTAQSGKAGVTVFRNAPIALPGAKPKPDLTLYKTYPVLILTAPGPVTFERLDEQAAPVTVQVPGTTLDTAKDKSTGLVPGGLYKVAAGAKSYVVKIDPAAKDDGGPALGRLIRF